MIQRDARHFDALENAGFRVDRSGDIVQILLERLGGHYVDVGASKKIAQGLVSHHFQGSVGTRKNHFASEK